MSVQPEVSVVIPTFNSAGTIQACLEAVFSSTFSDYEVVVADDASSDDTLTIVQRFPCKVVRSNVNKGASAMRNAGASMAIGTILMFIDSDIIVPPDAIGKAAVTLRAGACDAMVGMLDKKALYGNLASFYKNAYMHYTYSILPTDMDVFYTSVASIRREAFLAAGRFDEEYRRATIEDTEVGGRIRAKGYRIKLDKTMTVGHLRHYSLRELFRAGFRRTSGIVKIMLRRSSERSGESTFLTSPRCFTAGIVLSCVATLLLLLSLLAGWPLLVLSGFLFLVSLIYNSGFLLFVLHEGGVAKAVLSIPLMLVDQVAHGVGALHGLVTYMLGKRY